MAKGKQRVVVDMRVTVSFAAEHGEDEVKRMVESALRTFLPNNDKFYNKVGFKLADRRRRAVHKASGTPAGFGRAA